MWDRKGFTLIEMVAVIALTAMLAAVVGLVLASPVSLAQMSDVTERIIQIDLGTRDYSSQFDRPTRLVIDLDRQRVAVHRGDDGSVVGRPFHLPKNYRIDRVWLNETSNGSGRVELPCSARGFLPSYALQLAGPQDRNVYLFAVGLTGRFVEMKNGEEIEQTFKALADVGHDAD